MTRRWIALLLTVCMGLALTGGAAWAEAASQGETWYVYTENGKPLNVRILPAGEVVGQIESGEQVQVIGLENAEWAEITFHYNHPENGEGEWAAYVYRRYLTELAPAELEKLVQEETTAYTGDPITDINAEFASAKEVEPYLVRMRPARVTSWVNMRWIPSETGMILGKYKEAEELIVLKEMKHFLQVQDPDTGDVGYIHRKFATR